MTRQKQYIETNVYEEAKKRIHHIYDTHDNLVVAFSGGKDSLAVLHLVKEVAEERGIKKVNAVFRDEELIHKQVVDFVAEYLDKDWLNLEYWAVPLASSKYVMGEQQDYIQWDPNRRWIREKPDFAITLEDLDLPPDTVLSQYNLDDITIRNLKGKVCVLSGVRAAESLLRFRSVVNKLHDNYINASSNRRATMGKPIYDWQEKDIFKYFYDNDIKYCSIYDNQIWGRRGLRVASAISSEAAKDFGNTREVDPDLYEAVIDVFPEMRLQERYFSEIDKKALVAKYSSSWAGIEQWILENVQDPNQLKKTMKEFQLCKTRAETLPDNYPLDYVFKSIMNNGGKRTILPLPAKEKK
jgi:predicted phosphoadenosine phosphosulfate sulfurtransferase